MKTTPKNITPLLRINLLSKNIPFHIFDNNLMLARISRVFTRKKDICEKVLAHMMKNHDNGFYYLGLGSRKYCMEKLKITKSQYERATKQLLGEKQISRAKTANKRNMGYYQFNPFLTKMLSKRGLISIQIITELRSDSPVYDYPIEG